MAVDALESAGIAWREAFLGAGISTIGAAAAGGLAIALVARRIAPAGTVDVGSRFGLPALPPRDVVLHSTVSEGGAQEALRSLVAAIKAMQTPAERAESQAAE